MVQSRARGNGEFKILWLHKPAAYHQTRDADQYAGRKKITSQIEQIPSPAAGVKTEKSFENIDQIDEKIKNKSVKDKRM